MSVWLNVIMAGCLDVLLILDRYIESLGSVVDQLHEESLKT